MNPRDLELTLAAARAVGPCPPGEEAAWTEQVRARAVHLYTLADTVSGDLQRLDSAKQFTATLLTVRVEATSTRGILVVRNTSGELERLRTDRGDSDAGRAMIERARALVGHRLRVYRLNEQMASNAKLQVRTVVHLTDHGPDTDPIHEHSAKDNVLAAAEGDKDAARRAWQDAGLPETGSVSVSQLAAALAQLPAAEDTP
ncbi:hypothetical protein HUT19_41645 (plasmid) [Streptomyces sp. NA02950]|uniref:hypothetical protein n=1 Tax=Streptomyces sp. NA02950 TaxID=2742137 RepID=UPI001592174D|nr:hypothetical protein [Streptomyces sp. NA02950]QKV98227.1 hypothetical protein HUT19_41645 [Streptomyces sp. NA02950]